MWCQAERGRLPLPGGTGARAGLLGPLLPRARTQDPTLKHFLYPTPGPCSAPLQLEPLC